MPFISQYIDADVFTEHNGVTVYHSYNDRDYSSPYTYWFNTDKEDGEDTKFDIRDLSNYVEANGQNFKEVIHGAIESGDIKEFENDDSE